MNIIGLIGALVFALSLSARVEGHIPSLPEKESSSMAAGMQVGDHDGTGAKSLNELANALDQTEIKASKMEDPWFAFIPCT